MMKFNRRGYQELLNRIKPHLIGFQTPGNGIILRHDIDERLDRSMDMAILEAEMGVKSTYFVLDTASYWNYETPVFLGILAMMEANGHEIGWHNNAITIYYKTLQPMEDIIFKPLDLLRKLGLTIKGTASHGDPLCHEKGYINYNVFGFPSPKFPNYDGPVFPLSHFGLEYEAYHVGQTKRVSDSHGRWGEGAEQTLNDFFINPCRLELLVHPEWWDLT